MKEGVEFAGLIYCFKKVKNSDMVLLSDLNRVVIDPFRELRTLSFITQKNKMYYNL